jgi:hypothetical protein
LHSTCDGRNCFSMNGEDSARLCFGRRADRHASSRSCAGLVRWRRIPIFPQRETKEPQNRDLGFREPPYSLLSVPRPAGEMRVSCVVTAQVLCPKAWTPQRTSAASFGPQFLQEIGRAIEPRTATQFERHAAVMLRAFSSSNGLSRGMSICFLSRRSRGSEMLQASCAQASRATSWKSFLFNLGFENKRVRKIFGSGTVYGSVAPHA